MKFMESLTDMIRRARLILAVIFLQGGSAGLSIIGRFALNQGMSHYIFVTYRMAVATAIIAPFALILDRNSRPKITLSIIAKTMLLSLFDPVLDQNLFYMVLKHSTATFTSAMFNILPAFAFLMAWIFRLEKVNIRRLHSQAKLLGTIVTVGGAIVLTLVKGLALSLPWAKGNDQLHHQLQSDSEDKGLVKGALLTTAACFCWSCFIILQAITLRSYPCASLTAFICFWGMVEGAILALAMEWGKDAAVWSIHLDIKLLAALYGGILSGVSYLIMGMVIKERGPVFYSAFNPLGTVIAATLGSLILAEKMYFGSLIGAIIIIVGLYLVIWGKSQDQPPSQSQGENENENENENDLDEAPNDQQTTESPQRIGV